jgi:ribonuclease VapC
VSEPCVFDSSAILAVLFGEARAARVAPLVATASVSAVNHAEVVAKLVDRGVPPDVIHEVGRSGYTIVDFDARQAELTGRMRPHTPGLSLGDRACLALALTLGLPALTTDARMAERAGGATVHLIR